MKRIITTAALLLAVGAAAAQASQPARYCGAALNGLAIRAIGPTSCQFAKGTANTYLAHGHSRVRMYSDATHRYYIMRCRHVRGPGPDANPYILCTGANHARVEITS
jgi:hypothetical protein